MVRNQEAVCSQAAAGMGPRGQASPCRTEPRRGGTGHHLSIPSYHTEQRLGLSQPREIIYLSQGLQLVVWETFYKKMRVPEKTRVLLLEVFAETILNSLPWPLASSREAQNPGLALPPPAGVALGGPLRAPHGV